MLRVATTPAAAGVFIGEPLTMDSEFLFVYGTLRRACPTGAHAKYLTGAEFIATAKINGKLFKVSYYPGLVIDGTAGWVLGEIYRLASPQQLAQLDAYEECNYPALPGQEYQRQLVSVLTEAGDSIPAWVYAYQHASQDLQYIASGDFLNPC
ncbi:MAG TPA: gamma-glutamylcyclotransferase family protein [Cellvibrio sp.]|nr:gamma-glutamylcyclotransferase family protein [Cellvibrio sp.]